MISNTASIPRPLVRANQAVIVASVLISWVLSIWRDGFFLLLLIPLVSGLSGLITGYNPIFRIARRFLKKPAASFLQEDAADQRFNQILAVSMLMISLLSFILEMPVLGYVFSALVFTAALVAMLGFCVGCFIRYRLVMRRAARNRVYGSASD